MAKRLNQATLRDVAKAAGVDVSTASRVLQNSRDARVREDTRKRILDAAHQLAYRVNPLARALKTARSEALLMIVPQIENPIFSSAILGAEAEARQSGYALLVAYDRDGSAAAVLERVSRASLIEGVIIASFDDDDHLRQAISAIDLPSVVINRILPDFDACVALDTRAASKIVVEHLIDLGHRRIGHLAGRLGRFNGDARMHGWQDAFLAAGLEPDADLVVEAGYDPQRVPDAVDRLLSRDVTAIHAATLLTGAATVAHLHASGRRIPEDVSVVTLHDDLLAKVVFPQITTVEMPTEQMGCAAVRILVDRLTSRGDDPCETPMPALLAPKKLMIRGSSGPV